MDSKTMILRQFHDRKLSRMQESRSNGLKTVYNGDLNQYKIELPLFAPNKGITYMYANFLICTLLSYSSISEAEF